MNKIDEVGRYVYLPHKATLKIKSMGEDMDEAFAHMGLAVCRAIVAESELTGDVVKKIRVEGKNITTALYEFLNKLLALAENDSYLVKHLYFLAITQKKSGFIVTCELHGDVFKGELTHQKPKSATYTEMCLELDEETQQYHVTVVLE